MVDLDKTRANITVGNGFWDRIQVSTAALAGSWPYNMNMR